MSDNEIKIKRTIRADGSDRYEAVYGPHVILTLNKPPSVEQLQQALQAHRERNRPDSRPLDGV